MSEIFTIIDIETTGLDYKADHITEIAAIRVEMSLSGAYREIGRYQTYVALPEGAEIPAFITELTGITAGDLTGASTPWQAVAALDCFAYGSTVVAHNAPFDLAFLSRGFKPHNFVCTRVLSKLVEPSAESASLKYVCERHGIELNGHHRAINDAEATVKVLAKLRAIAEMHGIEYRNIVIDSEERPLTYVPAGAIVKKITKEAV